MRHDQGVIRNDDVRISRPPNRALDETFLIMIAGGVYALTASVGKADDLFAPKHLGQPSGEVAPHHVAVACGTDPPRHEAEGDRILGLRAEPVERFFVAEKAEIVFASLADDDAALLLVGIGMEAVQLLIQLPL